MIDAHHHIWLQKDLPWLLGPEQPRIFGAYGPIKRDYTIGEYLADIDGSGIEKSVYVQANWAPNWAADEAAWVQQVADTHGWPHAIVAYADFTVEDVRPQLDRLTRYPLMRGIRQQLHWHENPLYRFALRADLAADPTVIRNIGHLAAYGWSFDLQLFPDQFETAWPLLEACPDVTFILQHAGMHTAPSVEHWQETTGKALKTLKKYDNLVVKLSGLGTFIHRNDPKQIAFITAETVGIFGAKRCLFGSNFPIEKLWTSYKDLAGAYKQATAGLPKGQQKQILSGTAERVYRLEGA